PGTTTPSPGAAAIQLLQEFTAKIVNALQTGSLGSQLNTTILSLNVVDPLPPPVTTWTNTANQTTTEPTTNTYSPPDKIQVKQEANAVHTQTPFPIQPKIEAVDAAGNTLSQVGHPTDPWLVTVSVKNKPADVILGGVRSVPFVAGVATFSGLSLNKPGTYELIFQVTYPTTANRFTTTGRAFSIIEKPIPVVPPPDNNKTTLIAIIVGSVVGVLVIIIVGIMVWKGLCSSTSKSAKISCEVGDAGKAPPKYTEKMNLNEYVTVQPSTVTSFQSTSKETALDSKSEGPSTTAKTYEDDSVNHPHSTQDIEKSTQTDHRSHTPDSMPPPY
uniref:Uncharacterized protein n=1 Tax=Ciona savignyi TaxID=51511 RepID=H2Y4C7_CIOSA